MNNGTIYHNGEVTSFNTRLVLTGYQESNKGIVFQKPDIFLSHHNADTHMAQFIGRYLSRFNVICYVDTMDPNVDGDSPELEQYLRGVIGASRALMAIVSQTTQASWWVPLEIGVALEQNKHISTYNLDIPGWELPSYLWQWPILTDVEEAQHWAVISRHRDPNDINRSWRRQPKSNRRMTTRI